MIAWSLVIKNGSHTIIQNTKGSGPLRMKPHEVLLSQDLRPKKGVLVCWVEYSRHRWFWSAEIWTNCGRRPLHRTIGSGKSIFNWKVFRNYQHKRVILQHGNARARCASWNLQKINELGWAVLLHPPYSPDIVPLDFHSFRSPQHFLSLKFCSKTKNLKIWMSPKMPFPDILH